jgi:hypothetical protein
MLELHKIMQYHTGPVYEDSSFQLNLLAQQLNSSLQLNITWGCVISCWTVEKYSDVNDGTDNEWMDDTLKSILSMALQLLVTLAAFSV